MCHVYMYIVVLWRNQNTGIIKHFISYIFAYPPIFSKNV